MWKKVKEYMGAFILIMGFLAAVAGACTYFAKASDLEDLRAAYMLDKTTQRYHAVQERYWALLKECERDSSQCTPAVKEEIKHLKREMEELKRELDKKGS